MAAERFFWGAGFSATPTGCTMKQRPADCRLESERGDSAIRSDANGRQRALIHQRRLAQHSCGVERGNRNDRNIFDESR
jgi:hypothetical protein